MPYITATHNTVLKQKVLPSKVLKEEYPDSFLGIRKGAEIGVISVSGGWEGHKWVKLAGPLSGEESGWILPRAL